MSDAAPPPCPTIEEARELALAWARGQEPDPALLVWCRAFMRDTWGGEPIGSALTTGQTMAWKMGWQLGILLEVSPAGSGGVLPLCEAAGWPRHPEPGEDPLTPLR